MKQITMAEQKIILEKYVIYEKNDYWTCRSCQHKSNGRPNRMIAHLTRNPGKGIKICTNISPEKMEELKSELVLGPHPTDADGQQPQQPGENDDIKQEKGIRKRKSASGSGTSGSDPGEAEMSPSGIAAFEMEYGLWVEEQKRKLSRLRNALTVHIGDAELRPLVDDNIKHYSELFRIKGIAAKSDVFYVISGMWRTPSERFISWIGGLRPSRLIEVLVPQLDVLAESQLTNIRNLKQSCQQAEDALSDGLEILRHDLAGTVATIPLNEGDCIPQHATAIEKLEAIISFVNQADVIRNEALLRMSHILTTRQAARGLVALEEYFQRLQALSSIWATRPREPA